MPSTRSQLFLLRVSRRCSFAVICISILVLIGWFLGIRRITSLSPNWATVNPVVAGLFIVCGLVLYRRLRPPRMRIRRDWIAVSGASLVVLAPCFKLVEAITGLDLNLDRFEFQSLFGGGNRYTTCEIPINTAVYLLFCGLGLLLIDREIRGIRPAQIFFLLGGLGGWLGLIGYAFNVVEFYQLDLNHPMAFFSGLCLDLICLAGLFARPEHGVMRVITSNTTAGATARRLLPAAILIPLILGALHFSTERRGLVEVEFGVALFAVAIMIAFTALIWWNSRLLFDAEQERRRAERRLAVQYGATRVLAESSDVVPAIHSIIKGICERLGWQAGEWWRVDEKSRLARCEDVYVSSPELEEFAESARKLSLACGTGLPGKVWERREPVWVEDISSDPDFTRALAASQARLRCAVGFPIRYNGIICGVMEFFTVTPEPPDEPLLQTLSAVGCQIGQYVERKLAEEQLKQTSTDLARSNTDLQQFAYVASHDLSEPLRMIVSYLQLLCDRHRANLNREAQEFIGYAVDGAQRMQTMIQDLLAYARVDSRGREFQPANAEQVVSDAVLNLKVTIEEAGAAVTHDPLPVVRGDPVQLTQIFQNLISNAIKFRGKEPPRIHVSARRDGRFWEFAVRDNGIGIEPRNFERIFVLFQRLHTRQQYPGTGIGLAVVKKIVDRHGGRIWVESKPAEGTTFFFTLPVQE